MAVTALAPAVWGTTYLVTTELLPPGRPLLAALVRALPAGLALLAVTRVLPVGSWWWRSLVLGSLNIGVFFALLFAAAHRLPGGVAATVGAVQPLLVVALAAGLLGEAVTARVLLAGLTGLVGVGLLVLRADAAVDPVGVAAALGGAVVMAAGVVLTKRWGRPVGLLAFTAWQLTAGGLVLLPVTLAVEGLPPDGVSATNAAGFAYLAVVGTALAYALWFRGVTALPAASTAALGLLSPLVATIAGWVVLDQGLTGAQVLGAVLVLGAVTAVQTAPPGRPPQRVAGAARAPEPTTR